MRARRFFRDMHDAAMASGLADVPEYPLADLLRTSAQKHIFFRFLGGLVLTRPHLLGLLQVPAPVFRIDTRPHVLECAERPNPRHEHMDHAFVSGAAEDHVQEQAPRIRYTQSTRHSSDLDLSEGSRPCPALPVPCLPSRL